MIVNFKHQGLKRLFEDGESKGVRADLREKVENILAVLNRATGLSDMELPGFRLHPLKGDRKGFYGTPGASELAGDLSRCRRARVRR